MTFEERVRATLGQLHFANMQLAHQVEDLQKQLADQQTAFSLAQQAQDAEKQPGEKELPAELRANGGKPRPQTT